ncbi:hypothetical protein SEVIR_5G205001v4 [Setaria viridis]|uniref:Glucan endo-1,3-beta-D-glucosidase n=1 Tax=Setaria viridis TaxID=4556 RepID=A0A4V6D6N1_SETVI|nr:hypothetical protein SEVIR_5G205001v2 [Setaria viridis]
MAALASLPRRPPRRGIGVAPLLLSYADASELGVTRPRWCRCSSRTASPWSGYYDANSTVLNALAKTGIKVTVMVPNENLAAAAADRSYALRWLRQHSLLASH